MSLLDKKDEEIFKIAEPIWDNLVKSSNLKDYGSFTKDFSSQMLYGANEVELGKQWSNNELLTNLSQQKQFLGCLRRKGLIDVNNVTNLLNLALIYAAEHAISTIIVSKLLVPFVT